MYANKMHMIYFLIFTSVGREDIEYSQFNLSCNTLQLSLSTNKIKHIYMHLIIASAIFSRLYTYSLNLMKTYVDSYSECSLSSQSNSTITNKCKRNNEVLYVYVWDAGKVKNPNKKNLNFSKMSILLYERLNILSMLKVLHQFSLRKNTHQLHLHISIKTISPVNSTQTRQSIIAFWLQVILLCSLVRVKAEGSFHSTVLNAQHDWIIQNNYTDLTIHRHLRLLTEISLLFFTSKLSYCNSSFSQSTLFFLFLLPLILQAIYLAELQNPQISVLKTAVE